MRRPYRREVCSGSGATGCSSLRIKKKKMTSEFCLVIHPKYMIDDSPLLPMKFVQRIGHELSNVAIINVPCGKVWHVELQKIDCAIVFHSGWKDFAEYYSIATGHMLTFEYNRNSNFQVHIFDMTASEISYPKYIDQLDESNSGEETEEESPGSLDEDESSEEEEELEDESSSPEEELENESSSSSEEEELAYMSSRKRQSYAKATVPRRSSGKAQDNNRVIGVQYALKLKHPSFTVVMRPSYVQTGRYLPVPSYFNRYLKDFFGRLTLAASGGGTWPVGLINYSGHHIRLSKGWSKFTNENKIRDGDVCIFELIEDAILRVHIFHKDQTSTIPIPEMVKMDGGHQSSELLEESVVCIDGRHSGAKASISPKVKAGAAEVSGGLKLEHPSFKVAIKSANLTHNYLNLPVDFIRAYLEEGFNSATLKLSYELTWDVGCVCVLKSQFRLSRGWPKFAREAKLKKGDVCVFELIKKKDVVFKVYICHELEDK